MEEKREIFFDSVSPFSFLNRSIAGNASSYANQAAESPLLFPSLHEGTCMRGCLPACTGAPLRALNFLFLFYFILLFLIECATLSLWTCLRPSAGDFGFCVNLLFVDLLHSCNNKNKLQENIKSIRIGKY